MKTEIRNLETEILSDNFFKLKNLKFEYKKEDGSWENQKREVYHSGNGATVLLYNKEEKTVILIRQFRMPTYINGNESGVMIEACAGLLEDNNPEDCIIKEIEEETGYQVPHVKKIMECYMTPGSVAEMLHFFIAEYSKDMKVSEGGGLAHEHESIQVFEVPFSQALNMVKTGEIKDAKTIILLQYAQINKLL
ncbi:MAG: Nucleoside diphosphate pyrophosphatase [Sphingobacteriales bacterium]|nr:Nucleoside diphosphate pyrophosphatase [Sphingobacteriales bacterium]